MENLTPITHSASTSNLLHYNIVNNAEHDANIIDVPISEFVKSSVKICALYGLNVPELVLMQELFDFVKGHFHWVTLKHLELAFKMNASHELNKKVEHFGAFTISFIGDVLTAYRPIRDRIYLEANKVQPIAIESTNESESFSIKELISSHTQMLKNGKEDYIITGAWIIERLEAEGRIDVNSFREEDYQLAKDKAKKIVWNRMELTASRVRNMNESKKKEFKQSLINERLRQLYIIWLKK